MSAHRGAPAVRSPDDDAVGHSHRLPTWLFAGLAVIVLGLVGSLVLVAEQAIATNDRLTALEEYVAGKGEARDQENTRLNERIDQAVCSVLDQLPAGARLDSVRQQYGCGPGLPGAEPTSMPPAATSSAGATPSPRPAPPTMDRASPRPGPHATSATAPTSSPHTTGTPPGSLAPAPVPPAGPVTTILCGLAPNLCTRQ